MKVGDLIRYSGNLRGYGKFNEIGIVVKVNNNNVVTVLWNNGVESCHQIARLRRLKETA